MSILASDTIRANWKVSCERHRLCFEHGEIRGSEGTEVLLEREQREKGGTDALNSKSCTWKFAWRLEQ